jgi:hypothetical protein
MAIAIRPSVTSKRPHPRLLRYGIFNCYLIQRWTNVTSLAEVTTGFTKYLQTQCSQIDLILFATHNGVCRPGHLMRPLHPGTWNALASTGPDRRGRQHAAPDVRADRGETGHRNKNSDALWRELREAPLAQLCGHFLAATHRERGPISPPFTTRVAEGISACSIVFVGVFRPAWASPPFRWRCARPIGLGNRPVCLL